MASHETLQLGNKFGTSLKKTRRIQLFSFLVKYERKVASFFIELREPVHVVVQKLMWVTITLNMIRALLPQKKVVATSSKTITS